MIAKLRPEIEQITKKDLPALSKKLKEAGAPYILGEK
jgi:hypothetical protein